MAAVARAAHVGNTQADENKRAADSKAALLKKGVAAAPRAGVTQRRALSEIGNVVEPARPALGAVKETRPGVMTRSQHARKVAEAGVVGPTKADQHNVEQNKSIPLGRSKTSINAAAAPTIPLPGGHLKTRLPTAAFPQRAASTNSSAAVSAGAACATATAIAVAPAPAVAAAPAANAVEEVTMQEKERGHVLTMTAMMTQFCEEANGRADMEVDKEPVSVVTAVADATTTAAAAASAIVDIDWEDRNNPLHATSYIEDIYAFYRRSEKASMASMNYMSRQADINEKMRAILLDWLIEVHLKFKLMPETLYLTTNLIDRYLALAPVKRRNLQLVGVTAMLVASKYEEIWAPEVRDFVYISDNAYTKDEILGMEKDMLNALKFHLTVPTPYVFAARFLKAAAVSAAAGGPTAGAGGADKQAHTVAWYLLELCLPEYSMLKFSPSLLAASAVYTALLACQQRKAKEAAAVDGGVKVASISSLSACSSFSSTTSSLSSATSPTTGSFWCPVMVKHTGYEEEQLRECVAMMAALQAKSSNGTLTAVHKKYSNAKFGEVAKLAPAVVVEESFSGC